MRFLAIGAVLTALRLQEVRMVLLLLPTMAVEALVLVGAALLVRAYEVVHLPIGAHLALVGESGGAPPEVLPVVRIHTDFPVVVVLTVRAPNRLEQEHVEVHVNSIFLDQLDGELPLAVGEGAEFLVFARGPVRLEIRRAELRLVLIWVVELLDAVVGTLTGVSLRALWRFCRGDIRTDFGLISTERSPPVLLKIVIEGAPFEVVVLRILLALIDFESEEVEIEH